jgi:hypothetical protein
LGEAGSKLPADKDQSHPDAIVIESLIAAAVASSDHCTSADVAAYVGECKLPPVIAAGSFFQLGRSGVQREWTREFGESKGALGRGSLSAMRQRLHKRLLDVKPNGTLTHSLLPPRGLGLG